MNIEKEPKDIKLEDFKIIPGLESYAISKNGIILALPKIREGDLSQLHNMQNRTDKSQRYYGYHIIKQCFKQRYWYAHLMHNGIRKDYRVHRLIYRTYKGEIPKGMVIDHIDGNTKNNNIENLRCVTISENCRNPNTKYNGSKSIVQIDPNSLCVIATYKSLSDAEVAMGKNYLPEMSSHIGDCCKGKRRLSYGFIWQYLEDWNRGISNIKQDYRKAILQYDLKNNLIAEYPSIKEAANSTNLKSAGICHCASGKSLKYKNFIWKYKRN